MGQSSQEAIIACLTSDAYSQRYAQALTEYLDEVHGQRISAPADTFTASTFSGEEFDPRFTESVEGKTVYLVALCNPQCVDGAVSPTELMMRLVLTAFIAREQGARSVKAVCPDLPFSRADKLPEEFEAQHGRENNRGRGRVARGVAQQMASAGIDEVLTLDVHSDAVRAFYEEYGIRLHALSPNPLIAHYIQQRRHLTGEEGENLVLVSPDEGAAAKVEHLAHILQHSYRLRRTSVLYLEKMRTMPNAPGEVDIRVRAASEMFTGLVNRYAIMYDDIVDTAGTFSKACRRIRDHGIDTDGTGYQRPGGLVGFLVHPVLAGSGYEAPLGKLSSAGTEELVFFNTHPFIGDVLPSSLAVGSIIDTAPLFAEAVSCVQAGGSPDGSRVFENSEGVDTDRVGSLLRTLNGNNLWDRGDHPR